MNEKQKSIKKEYKNLISITIAVIGLLGSIASIYALVASQKQSAIAVDIISNTNVLDVNTEVSDLDILYKSESLKKEKKELKLILVRIKNIGDENILKTHFDEDVPFGLKVLGGTIVETPEILETSNSYLSEKIQAKSDSLGGVYFSPVIIDKNASFVIKILILSSKDKTPSLKVIGKIAGINNEIVPSYSEPEVTLPFFKQVFIGNIWVHLVKALIYFIIVVLFIIAIFIISESLSERKKKKNRERKVEEFIKSDDYTYRRIHDVIFEKYKQKKGWELASIYRRIQDEDILNKRYVRLLRFLETEKEKSDKFKHYTDEYHSIQSSIKSYDKLISEGFVTKEEDRFVINRLMKETLNEFIKFANLEEEDKFWFRDQRLIHSINDEVE